MNDNPERREIPFGRPMIGQEEKDAMIEVLSGHILTHGPKCAEFEEKFAARIGVKHAVTTSSCTTALHLSLMAVGVTAGDEVIVPAETHVATAHAVEHQGAHPVFVDVERSTGNIDPELIEVAITDKTRAIVVVHYLGLPCDMDAINKIAARHNLPVLEDCALALGARWDGQKPGGIGATGSFSFYPTKHMTTLEGGMLTTNDDDVASLVRQKRAFGYDRNLGERSQPGVYDIATLGYNYRMSEGHAAVGICQLDKLNNFIEVRRKNTDILLKGLTDIQELTTFPVIHGKASSGFYCVNAVLPESNSFDRRSIVASLNAAGVGTSVHYPVALPLSRYYSEKYSITKNVWPVANWISTQTISLPVGPHLNTEDMTYICNQMKTAILQGRN
jgi:perosamine synthetase